VNGRLLRAGLADLKVNAEESRYVVHTTADPDVFIVEIDTAFDRSEETEIVSLVKIFHVRDGEILLLRDYVAGAAGGRGGRGGPEIQSATRRVCAAP
jgi:hypothetical protein